jgi:hypothetical protein
MSDKDKRLEAIIRSAPSLVSDTLPVHPARIEKMSGNEDWIKFSTQVRSENISKLKEYAFRKKLLVRQVLDMALTEYFERKSENETK